MRYSGEIIWYLYSLSRYSLMMFGVCQGGCVKGFAILLDGSPPQHLNRCHSAPHALVPLTFSGLSNRMAAGLALSV